MKSLKTCLSESDYKGAAMFIADWVWNMVLIDNKSKDELATPPKKPYVHKGKKD